jgi:hypothetical protein
MNKLLPKIIFYGLIVGVAFAIGVFYHKTTGTVKTIPNNNSPIIANINMGANKNINSIKTPPTNKPVVPPKNTPTPVVPVVPPAPVVPTCIITIDGQRYDVQPLRNSHSGGDVFQCGTDMSAIFHDQHGNRLKMILPYLIK